MEVGDIVPLKIKRYREKDDTGIGITNTGRLAIVKEMQGEAEAVALKITNILEETVIGIRVFDYQSLNEAKPVTRSKASVYGYDEDDDDYDDDDENLSDEY